MAKESIEEILRRFEQSNPRQQTTSISSIEGKASEDSVGFTKEQLSFIQEDLTTRSVVITSSRLCNCGKIITQKTSLAGSCQNRGCKNLVCSECIRTCRCGKTFIAGPLRKPMFSVWRMTFPLIIGGIVGFVIVNKFMSGAPAWMKIVGQVMAAFMIGGAISELLATVFPQRRDSDAR